MKTTKKWTLIFTVFICLALLSTSTVWAGPRGRHWGHHSRHHHGHYGKDFWPGLAIGVGATLVGAAILNSATSSTYVYQAAPPPAGHYEYRQVWVPPQYQKTWVAGHYDRYGHWMAGHWQSQQVRPGYYTQQRVWVSY